MTSHRLEAAVRKLRELGFKKRSGNLFTLELAPDVLGWLGLNQATRHHAPGEVEVNPVIGVRFQEVERLVAQLRGEKFHTYIPPTISRPLGYLMPENRYTTWLFSVDRSEEVASDMASAIAMHGIPYMRSVVGIAELRREMDSGAGHQLQFRRPVAALLAGDPERARSLLNDELAAIGARSDPAAEDFKKFAQALFRSLQ